MSLPGGIRIRIVLVLVGIVAGALGTAYLIVVPSLERRLVDARLDQLEHARRAARAVALRGHAPLAGTRRELRGRDQRTRRRVRRPFDEPPGARRRSRTRRRRTRATSPTTRSRSPRSTSGDVERGRVLQGGADYANVAVPLDDEAVVLFQAPLADSLATVRLVASDCCSRLRSRSSSRSSSGSRPRECSRTGSCGSRRRPSGSRAETSTHRSSITATTRSASSRARSTACACSSRSSTTRARSSSRTRRTSCGRRSSRSAGSSSCSRDEELDEETRRGFIETMQGQVQRLAKLSTDLLDLSRVDAGQLSVAARAGRPRSVVRMLAGELEHLATSTEHELRRDIDGDVWCLGDEERVLQIGRALATNALMHTPAGTQVTLRARRSGGPRELVVEDDGPGIPPTQQDAVFDRFYRVEGGMASGSGLGLAIARELARLMDGDVIARVGGGADGVHVELPGEPAPDEPGGRFHVKTFRAGASTSRGRGADYDLRVSRDRWTISPMSTRRRRPDGRRRRKAALAPPCPVARAACGWRPRRRADAPRAAEGRRARDGAARRDHGGEAHGRPHPAVPPAAADARRRAARSWATASSRSRRRRRRRRRPASRWRRSSQRRSPR